MDRRGFLKTFGIATTGLVSIGGIGWWVTRDDLSLSVRNLTESKRPVSISVETGSDTIFHDSFEVPASETIDREDIAKPGQYTLSLTLDYHGDNKFEHEVDTQLCHTSRMTFEIDIGNALAIYEDC
ncbi:hypothetical protein ACFQS4_09390 [Saliphagus sp. GCM10025317]